jgi:4-amino-4-deoxy-L-arabinose transferase-like glycosyltransferase
MWPVYVIYAAFALALLAAALAVPLARRGARRLLWGGWAALAVALPTAAAGASVAVVPPELFPPWRLAAGFALLLAAPTGAAAHAADRIARRRPAPGLTAHAALVMLVLVAALAAAAVASRPFFPDMILAVQ